jgi:alkylation response protein AidB-like acyl-CoA dehydrogenase
LPIRIESHGRIGVSEERELLLRTAERIFCDIVSSERLAAAERGIWDAEGWRMIDEAGLPLALVPEERGGIGFPPADALAVLRVAGAFALPFPLPETMIANRLLALAGLPLPDGIFSVATGGVADALSITRDSGGWRVSGRLTRVPWGRSAGHVVTMAGDAILCLPRKVLRVSEGASLAGEPRDDLVVEGWLTADLVTDAPAPGGLVRLAGAAVRSIALAGAVQRMLEMTTAYAGERVQFGRAIGKFQTIQQYLATFAGHAAATAAAADLAAQALAADLPVLPIAIAKARAGEAAGAAAALAHQIHGAIGLTYEHALQHLTRRVWSWRDEFGSEAEWAALIGQQVCRAGAEGLWPLAVST